MSALRDFVKKPPAELMLAFVPTAGDPYEHPTFVDKDRQKLQDMGFTMYELDIKDKTEAELKKVLSVVDVLYVAGGNTFYLLEKMQTSRLDKLLPAYLDQGMLYVGASAGAVVVCPDIAPIKCIDDPSKAAGLKSTKGLGLVPFVVLPHYDTELNTAQYQEIIDKFGKSYELILLTDEQACLVEDSSYRIISSG
jgi:dipeptidase E